MIRLTEGAVALGFGAADAFVENKVTSAGPGGVPWVVYLEALGLVGGLFGEKIGLSPEIRDPLAFSALTLAGARLSDAASAGQLAAGPKAWGKSLGAYSSGLGAMNTPPSLPANAAASIRLLPGRSASQSAFSMSPTLFEAAGVTG